MLIDINVYKTIYIYIYINNKEEKKLKLIHVNKTMINLCV